MPAAILNNSPAKWLILPLPADAMLTLPGLALACAMNSATVVAGTDGCTTIRLGVVMIPATGAVSRMKLKFSFVYNVALIAFTELARKSVYPSGAERTTASAAILLPAPGRFSMMNGRASRSDSHCPMIRAAMSVPPPAAKPEMMRTGRDG